MADPVVAQVRFEIEQIDRLFESYASLLEQVRQRAPTLVELTAVASVLHSFYNGIENMFLSIAKGIDANVPTDSQWHRDLLTRMSKPAANRTAVLSPETALRLSGYLGFRHFYRHSYSFFLEWDELEKLAIPVSDVWTEVKKELELFLNDWSSTETQANDK